MLLRHLCISLQPDLSSTCFLRRIRVPKKKEIKKKKDKSVLQLFGIPQREPVRASPHQGGAEAAALPQQLRDRSSRSPRQMWRHSCPGKCAEFRSPLGFWCLCRALGWCGVG